MEPKISPASLHEMLGLNGVNSEYILGQCIVQGYVIILATFMEHACLGSSLSFEGSLLIQV